MGEGSKGTSKRDTKFLETRGCELRKSNREKIDKIFFTQIYFILICWGLYFLASRMFNIVLGTQGVLYFQNAVQEMILPGHGVDGVYPCLFVSFHANDSLPCHFNVVVQTRSSMAEMA